MRALGNLVPGLFLNRRGRCENILKPLPYLRAETAKNIFDMPYFNARGNLAYMTVEISDSRLTNSLANGCGEILKGVRNGGLLRGLALGDAAMKPPKNGSPASSPSTVRLMASSEEAADDLSRLKKDRVDR